MHHDSAKEIAQGLLLSNHRRVLTSQPGTWYIVNVARTFTCYPRSALNCLHIEPRVVAVGQQASTSLELLHFVGIGVARLSAGSAQERPR